MVTVGMLIRFHARPGKERDVETFLEGVMPLIRDEGRTEAFLGFSLGQGEYGIVNGFPDDAGRDAHATGHAAQALFGRAEELFDGPPRIEPITVVSAKLPGDGAR